MSKHITNGDSCVIIPAYQEGHEIARTVRGALKHAKEVLVVDDGSTDKTGEQARAAGASVVRHPENLGKGCALLSGLQYAAGKGYPVAITIDGDGQHDPGEIPKLLDALERGADIVVGCRMNNPDGMPLERLLTNRFMSAVLSLLARRRIRDTQSGFKAMRVDRVRRLKFHTRRFDWESELIIKAARGGLRMREVDIKSIYGNHHRSKIAVVSDTYRFLRLVLKNILR